MTLYLIGPDVCNQGYGNFHEKVWITMVHPETRNMYHCPAYHFYEICIPLVNEPIRFYQIQSLNLSYPVKYIELVYLPWSPNWLQGKAAIAKSVKLLSSAFIPRY